MNQSRSFTDAPCASRVYTKESIQGQRLVSLFLLVCLYLNHGITDLLIQKLVQPVTPLLSADHLRYFFPMKAFSCILLLALKTWALSGQGKHFSSHHSRILGDEHAAGWMAGKRVPTQSPASPGEHGAGQTQKPPLRTLSAGPAVLTPGALCRGSILCGCQGAWALPTASPCPEPPRRRGPVPHSAPLPEPRADPQGCSAQPLRPSFSALLLATAEALRGHCEARGWRYAGHALFPVMTPSFLDLPGHRPQASSPRKRHLLGQGSPPAFSRSTVLCTRLCPRLRLLPAPLQGGCREACICPSCCVSDTLSPRTRPSVRRRSSVDLNMNRESI